MDRIKKHWKRWRRWQKFSDGSWVTKLLVLFNIVESRSFNRDCRNEKLVELLLSINTIKCDTILSFC